ncbi:e4 control protein orf1 [Human mastadenovirus B]|uniref:E4 control protein orf1 n=1 Tax=Human mastadenovirus B TaxID=108098 RepID=A0A6N0URL2_9ADEN|nr:e4 control protein orf1 [Human mastadenovirus B]
MANEALYVYLEGPGATLPEQQQRNNYIFYSPVPFTLYPRGVALLYLRLSIIIPRGYVGCFFSLTDANMSGLYASSRIIHAGHREELSVLLFNHDDRFYEGRAGDPVACLVMERLIFPPVRQATII